MKVKMSSMVSKNSTALAFKAEGNSHFKAKSYAAAIEQYTKAIDADSQDVTFFSNRSACYAALEKWEEAAADGRQCVILDKNFVKGYFRAATGQEKLGNFESALEFVKRGLGVESGNKDLKDMSRRIEESVRMQKVNGSISTAEEQMQDGDIAGAYKTIDSALRLDPSNSKLNAMMDRVRPKWEASEKARVSGLDPVERVKEAGDTCFKSSQFETAIEKYTQAINKCTDPGSEIALKCYANRAACYKQLSNFDGTIGDCSHVLEYKDDDVKALVRRAQAFEACERYKFALQDVRQVLAYGAEKAGKANYDLANNMQHRLNRVIQQLKSM